MRRRKLYIFLFVLLAAFIFSQVSSCFISRNFIFNAKGSSRKPRVAGGHLLKINNEGRQVYAFFSRASKKLVVFFHGSRRPMQKEEAFARRFRAAGYSVLLVEYAGYGYAKNYSASESKIYSDSSKMIGYVQKKYGFKARYTYAWGRSLGSGVAAEMAKRKIVSRAILVTPYTSIAAVAEHKSIPWLPRILIYDNFNTASKADEIEAPILLIHGKRDKLTPYKMSLQLKKKFKKASLITLPRANHYNIYRHLSRAHWRRVFRFLR